ncbi:Sigma-70 family RNA polymerase sigma factor [Sulfidibacter corallicola]|uniref:Sigma-70 family RNA polymerase sigma factor n=1 Tax=Sulfidibacter corallicola TaxID=2818388 RepID=A0A8A4TZD7_SULCO|nr:ECF-type sigma factor [Sulfidibacter corallicola]QTD51875.1 sigma-70 family RNA polymerase sigma factor [Sulfidibacter corallicola]
MEPSETESQITHLLQEWKKGDDDALDVLLPMVFHQLQAMARKHLRGERADHTFSTMDLVNEAYCKLFSRQKSDWNDRVHFFAVAGKAMRNILITHAVRRGTQKRGAGQIQWVPVDLQIVGEKSEEDLRGLDEALDALAKKNREAALIVELHFFCGCTLEEIGRMLEVSQATVKRRMKLAKAWLGRYLEN